MKIIIFAGGIGTRMWPLSRRSLPKQFIKMFDGKSTLELAVRRVKSFGYENIYISTLQEYVTLTKQYLPKIPAKNIIGEPALRNVAPAVGYNLVRLRSQGYKGPVAILWADHLIKDELKFLKMLKEAEGLSKKHKDKMVFVGKKPRFANNNLGWIHIGKKIAGNLYGYKEWRYKPQVDECEKMFKSGDWLWNTGYFIFDNDFGLHLFEKYQPDIYKSLQKIEKVIGSKKEKQTVNKIYPTIDKIHFDNAIAMKLTKEEAVVMTTSTEWSDPGTLYALKEALSSKQKDNSVKGNVVEINSEDSIIINEEREKLVSVIGAEGMVIVNTKDAMLVVPKESVKEISDLLLEMEKNKALRKYL
jgi:mannose-1-phosphate guanylyltransferase